MPVNGNELDRAAGTLLAMACGDALGAGYEFGPPLPADTPVAMVGGGPFGWEPGEWTDDTSMAYAIAQVAATGADLRTSAAQDQLVANWAGWAATAADVGAQTSAVIGNAFAMAVRAGRPVSARDFTAAAVAHHEATGRSAGNGSLMRTAPVALAFLDDEAALTEAATAISALTHHDPEAGEACVLWCAAIRHAVLNGTFDGLHAALQLLPADRAAVWAARLTQAQERTPDDFCDNGWVVQALQAAWSAIWHTRPAQPGTDSTLAGPRHLGAALEAAVRGGRDTDTVAAIAGALLGAVYGASAVPAHMRRVLHGWPGARARDLVIAAALTVRGGRPDSAGWPTGPVVDYSGYPYADTLVAHPHDPGVWLAGSGQLASLPDDVDAVVSLCRLGTDQPPPGRLAPADHVEVWLVDSAAGDANPHLGFVLTDAAHAVAALRREGKTVLLHCVQAQSRTPTVAALYGSLVTGRSPAECLAEVCAVLPGADPNAAFTSYLATATPLLPV